MILSIVFGLLIGSFANVCIYRLPKDLSLWKPGSHCPVCQRPLKWYENIPVLSYSCLQGKCRTCGASISLQYPLVELTMMGLFALCQWRFQGVWSAVLLGWVLSFYLLTITLIDFRHRIIPDELSLTLLIFGISFAYFNPTFSSNSWYRLLESVLAALSGGLLMTALAWVGEKIFKKEALGGGDVKLIAAFGAALGWQGIVDALLIGSLCGGTIGIVLLLLKMRRLGDTIPFGPFLCLGAGVSYLCPAWWKVILGIAPFLNFP